MFFGDQFTSEFPNVIINERMNRFKRNEVGEYYRKHSPEYGRSM